MELKVVFTGGGTGGHLYPAIAIADALRERGATIDFIGTADRLEATIVPKAGYRLHTVYSGPMTRTFSFKLVRTAIVNAIGVLQSVTTLSTLKPTIVIATGGYVCFPVVMAARVMRTLGMLKCAIVLVEPNAHPGLTNRLLAPLVDEVWGAFANVDARFAGKYVHTGIPVRASLRTLPPRDAAITSLGLSPKRHILLAMGGSQGARSINDALTVLLKSGGLPEGWQLALVTGEKEYDRVRASLGASDESAIRPYVHDLSEAFAAADLVLARAGASTLGELAAVGLPAVLVPYPHAAEDHQTRNAEVVRDAGAAVILTDRELESGALRTTLAEVTAPGRLAALRAAASRLVTGDPLATILARVEALLARKKPV